MGVRFMQGDRVELVARVAGFEACRYGVVDGRAFERGSVSVRLEPAPDPSLAGARFTFKRSELRIVEDGAAAVTA